MVTGVQTCALPISASKNQYDIYTELRLLGQIFGVEDKAEKLIKEIQQKIDEIVTKLRQANVTKKPKVLQLYGPPSWGLWSTGGDTFIHWLIVTAGGTNIAAKYSGWVQLDYEYILSQDPEIIIITVMKADPKSIYEEVVKSPLVNTSAWKNGRVYLFTEEADDALCRPSWRIVVALDILAHVIHPEVFGEIHRADVINIATMKLEAVATSLPTIAVAAEAV